MILYPDPHRYYLKDRPIYDKNDLSEAMTIPSKISEPSYSFEYLVTTIENNSNGKKNTHLNYSNDNSQIQMRFLQ